MNVRCFSSHSAADTRRLGRALGAALSTSSDPGLVIALDGDLGVGKTVFVKGLAEGLGVEGDVVSSPTFVIAQRYEGGGLRLHHIDLYRIDEEDELLGFGFDELLDPPDVAAVEWSNRFPDALPVDRLRVVIERVDGLEQGGSPSDADARRITVESGGRRSEAVWARWSGELERSEREGGIEREIAR